MTREKQKNEVVASHMHWPAQSGNRLPAKSLMDERSSQRLVGEHSARAKCHVWSGRETFPMRSARDTCRAHGFSLVFQFLVSLCGFSFFHFSPYTFNVL